MSSSSRSLDENLANVGQPRRPDPCISANHEQMAEGEPGLVLPTSREIQDAWEEVAGREQEPEAEEEPEAVEVPEVEEDAEAEAQCTPPITDRYLQATITNDIDSLFSPETITQIRAENNIQLDSAEPVASKKQKNCKGGYCSGRCNHYPCERQRNAGAV